MQLQPKDVEQIISAIEAHFDPFAIDRLLETRFAMPLVIVTSVMKNFSQQTVDVLRYFDQRNRVDELILALHDARPRVPVFARILDEAGLTCIPPNDTLEILVRTGRGSFKDVASFRGEIARIEAAVCRIQTPYSFGTGFLMGTSQVLTNFHVIKDCIRGDNELVAPVECHFDFKTGTGGYATPVIIEPAKRVLYSSASPTMRLDMDVDTERAALDYAILEVSDGFANRPVVSSGDSRGSILLAPTEYELRPQDGLLVVQHPRALPMKIDFGSVLSLGEIRLRHSVNTLGGSSGSPVFDADLTLVAVHHAGFNWPKGSIPFNQAIRIDAIAADIKSKKEQIEGE